MQHYCIYATSLENYYKDSDSFPGRVKAGGCSKRELKENRYLAPDVES